MLRFIALALLSLHSLPAQTNDYFPLVPGSQWLYRSSAFSESFAIQVGAEQQLEGQTYWEVRGYHPTKTLLVRRTPGGDLLRFEASTKQEVPWLDWSGRTVDNVASDCQQRAQASERRVPFAGPLGNFENAVEVQVSGGICADTGLTKEVFVPNLGLAERMVTSFTGPRKFELVYAQIGGVTYLSDAQISFTIALTPLVRTDSRLQYAARLSLSNRSQTELVLPFPSSQRYDLRLLDATGEVVYTWSSTRLFLAVTGQVVVKDEVNWLETFDLPAVRPGIYSIEGFLTNSDGRRFRATAGIEVKAAP